MANDFARQINETTGSIINAAIKVHRALGPGLLESAYNVCLLYELRKSGVHVEAQRAIPIKYDGISLDCGYRLDMVVDNRVIVELKAIEEFRRIFPSVNPVTSVVKRTPFPPTPLAPPHPPDLQ